MGRSHTETLRLLKKNAREQVYFTESVTRLTDLQFKLSLFLTWNTHSVVRLN